MANTCVGCMKPAGTLKCPNCSKLGRTSHFCSQDCFRKSWAAHKLSHVVLPVATEPEETFDDPRFNGFAFTGKLRPAQVTPQRTVPKHIEKPDYWKTGEPLSEMSSKMKGAMIPTYTAAEIKGIRKACRLGRKALNLARDMIEVGVTTDEIDEAVHNAIVSWNSYPSPLNYRGFPKSLCTSINESICHGIPDTRPLEDGDIVNVDVTVFHKGFHGDLNETFLVGNVDEEGRRLVKVTKECLDLAIEAVRPGVLYREIGDIISRHAHKNNFSVVRSYCGHGIGRLFHTLPNIPHYARNKAVGVMKPGSIFSIEPMINEGVWRDTLWPDDWTSVTKDGKRSAQFEHTMLVTETGVEVLTADN